MGGRKNINRKIFIEFLEEKFEEYSHKELYSMIMCGEIKVNGETIRAPRCKINPEAEITLTARKWVSRGGEKLEYALSSWGIDAAGKTVIDAGSSTGGFTDCLLQRGASHVYSVDVGYNQLDYKLRIDDRVSVLERTNIMSLTELSPQPDFAVADLSFRSITGAASHILNLTKENLLLALIKPQFELTDIENFDGIIRDKNLLYEVLVATALSLQNEGVEIKAVLESPIKGGKGNTEFIFDLRKVECSEMIENEKIVAAFISTH
ncbi:MAG: TlyA family RNA methyltransferase [Spirochaetales bacterium]|uniref:TlyA family RNA methyltransferase n=1 Tax=Candidatus Thalassospirochaeta sargassi TaxID=3119039 RepID=A0AAJ1IJ22_9SPIO|nr:TlyA family RNA methyltransferase [Spirochaetales bacterium]